MGEHEEKASRKRFRKGSAIKYYHADFARDSTNKQLSSIKRRTCPSTERQHLSLQVKESRQNQTRLLLQYKRLNNIVKALHSEIHVRKEYAKKRKLTTNINIRQDASNSDTRNSKESKYCFSLEAETLLDNELNNALDRIEPIDLSSTLSLLDVSYSFHDCCSSIVKKRKGSCS